MADKLWTCCINSEGDNNQYKKVRIYFITDSVWELLDMLSCYVTSVVTGANLVSLKTANIKSELMVTIGYMIQNEQNLTVCLCKLCKGARDCLFMGMKLTTCLHPALHLKEAMVQGQIEPDSPNTDVYDSVHVYIYLGWKNRLWFHHLLHRSYLIGNVPSWNVTVPYHNVHNHGKQVIHLGVNICKPVSLRGPSCKNNTIPLDLLVDWYSKSSFNTGYVPENG